jgi:hypothetical protein
LPRKFAVRGLPGVKRRDAKAAGRSALDSELSRRQDARRVEDGPTALAGTVTRMRDGGGPLAAGAGGTALRRRPAPCVPNAKAAGLGRRPPAARLPANPSRLRREPLARPTPSLGEPRAHARSPARAGRPRRAQRACHLRRRESPHRSGHRGAQRGTEGVQRPVRPHLPHDSESVRPHLAHDTQGLRGLPQGLTQLNCQSSRWKVSSTWGCVGDGDTSRPTTCPRAPSY